VLLLTIDTLRADKLGFAGCPEPVSPHLDRLARRGVVFSRALTPLPRTLPALASLMTGAYPHAHGVRDNFHYALGESAATLAERLRAAGWATAAVNSNPVLAHDSGIYQGFESANDRGEDWSHLSTLRGFRRILTLLRMRRGDRAAVLADLAIRWLRERPRERPFFLWVHWLAPHMPYEPAPPFDRRFDPDYRGEYERSFHYGRISKGEMTYRNPLGPRALAHAVALYEGEVATTDRAVGRLLRAMELSGDLRNTYVLFTADHGESLVEHGYFFNHGDFVYGPAANVPLVWCPPGGRGALPGVSEEAVSLVDLAPRLLAVLGLETEGAPAPRSAPRILYGESGFCRFPHLNDRLGFQLPRAIAQSPERVPDWKERWEAQANRAKQRFAIQGDWKLVRSPREEGDREELFDLTHDPGERVDVAARFPARAAALGEALDRWMAEGERTPGQAPERVLDEETRARMEALGYVGD
jgi:arylsulfatase A-like enzyme